MKKGALLAIALFFVFMVVKYAHARDWELWTQESFSVQLTKKLSYTVLPEWRFKNDMNYNYLFKVETGPTYKINSYLDAAIWYVYQEKQASNKMWDRADLSYVDLVAKIPLKSFFDLKISNRARYQYNYSTAVATFRNSFRMLKTFKPMNNFEVSPYIQEEPFYDCKDHRIVEHRTSSGFTFTVFKNYSLSLAYMLNSKKATGASKWAYTNVFLANLGFKF